MILRIVRGMAKLTIMRLKNTQQDKEQWDEFHSEKSIQGLASMKASMQNSLMLAIDGFLSNIEIDKEVIVNLTDYKSHDYYPNSLQEELSETIREIQMGIEMAQQLSNFYMVLLDVNTYAYNCFMSKDDWEWRVFARHIYTVMYEHRNSINKMLNDVVKISKDEMSEVLDQNALKKAKKDFVKVTEDIANYAKTIRVNVDAHFDGDFEQRLRIIEDMSYMEVVKVIYDYWTKASILVSELSIVVGVMQKKINGSMAEVKLRMQEFLGEIKSKKR